MKTFLIVVRLVGTGVLINFVKEETGPFTAVSIFLLAVGNELISGTVKKMIFTQSLYESKLLTESFDQHAKDQNHFS